MALDGRMFVLPHQASTDLCRGKHLGRLIQTLAPIFVARSQATSRFLEASDLSLFAAKVANHARQSSLVQRHNLYPGAARLPLSGRNHGLGNPQGLVLAAVQYAGR